jgi:hypothetical protein
MDETCIYLFTYDEMIHEYDFEGEEIRCTVIDRSIKNQNRIVSVGSPLKRIRVSFGGILG